jgi:4'-phosphopantetheinyl transferase
LPPASLRLDPPDCHVWRIDLAALATLVDELILTLSDDERHRADRFHFPDGRLRYVVARGAMRDILSRYLDCSPATVRFQYSEHGKPALAGRAAIDLRFNLAHSGTLALCAVARGRSVGVDLERERPDFAGQRIADRFFSPREAERLRALPREQRDRAFLDCWTRKEAYIKARGEGLSFPLNAFDVALVPGEPAALLATHGDPDESARWTLLEINAGREYAAALAIEGAPVDLSCWQWPGIACSQLRPAPARNGNGPSENTRGADAAARPRLE